MVFCDQVKCLINISLIVLNIKSTLRCPVLLLRCSSRCSLHLPLTVSVWVLFFTQEKKKNQKQNPVRFLMSVLEHCWLRKKMVFFTEIAIQKNQSCMPLWFQHPFKTEPHVCPRWLDSGTDLGKWGMETKYSHPTSVLKRFCGWLWFLIYFGLC